MPALNYNNMLFYIDITSCNLDINWQNQKNKHELCRAKLKRSNCLFSQVISYCLLAFQSSINIPTALDSEYQSSLTGSYGVVCLAMHGIECFTLINKTIYNHACVCQCITHEIQQIADETKDKVKRSGRESLSTHPTLPQCWTNGWDVGPALWQRWVKLLSFQDNSNRTLFSESLSLVISNSVNSLWKRLRDDSRLQLTLRALQVV